MTRAAVVIVALFTLVPLGYAHKGITSKFTYNADVHPVFLARCGRCHRDEGVGPMSLLKYEDAFPWAESLRAEMLTAADGDPHDFIKAAHRQISAKELDIILDWAGGGTPEGDKERTPEPAHFENTWSAGPPQLTLAIAPPFQLRADAMEATQDATLTLPSTVPHTIARFDVLPGNPAIVRSVVVSLRTPDGTARVLGTWVPRQNPSPIIVKPAIRIQPGSQILARLHYKKTWKYEGEAMTDQSAIGLYSAD